mmetsp:Transcript_38645/g.106445  ORF Transcript_38645/g.106445 Transcript_38645/m.106445 type:complete len:201 (-) Transcript_38645:790-1392(-)
MFSASWGTSNKPPPLGERPLMAVGSAAAAFWPRAHMHGLPRKSTPVLPQLRHVAWRRVADCGDTIEGGETGECSSGGGTGGGSMVGVAAALPRASKALAAASPSDSEALLSAPSMSSTMCLRRDATLTPSPLPLSGSKASQSSSCNTTWWPIARSSCEELEALGSTAISSRSVSMTTTSFSGDTAPTEHIGVGGGGGARR